MNRASTVPFIRRIPSNKDITSSSQNQESKSSDLNPDDATNQKVREMVIRPLLYESSDVLSNRDNSKSLKDILDMMVIFPDLNAVITGHTHDGGSNAYDLYFSIKNAEQVSNYLLNNGISPERLGVYGAGSNYPMVKSLGSNLATKNNNRIEISLTDQKVTGLNVTYTYPIINDYLKDDRASAYRQTYNGVVFRIEVARANQMYDNQKILTLDNVIIEKESASNSYIYTVGNCFTYDQALDLRKALAEVGIDELKMHVYLDGIRLSEIQIQNLKDKYPEINSFSTNEIK